MRRDCITWKCPNKQKQGNVLFCKDCLLRMDAEAERRNQERKKQAENEECVYCGESGDSDKPDKQNLVPVPQEYWTPWAHQGCIEFTNE